jgi:hypothetical protein
VRRSAKRPKSRSHPEKKILSKKLAAKSAKPVSKREPPGDKNVEHAKPFESTPKLPVKKSGWIAISRCSLSKARDFLLKRLLRA